MSRFIRLFVLMLATITTLVLVAPDAEARRMGGGKSFGKSSGSLFNRTPAQKPTQSASSGAPNGASAAAGGAPELFPYAASKQALVGMTKNSSFALLRHRIRVNLIQPGWMNTPAEDGIQRRFHGATDGWLEAASAKQPFGRLIDPHELARTVVFVSSDEAGLMTGAVIEYDQTVLGPDMSRSDLEPVWGEPASGRGEAPADADRGVNDVR